MNTDPDITTSADRSPQNQRRSFLRWLLSPWMLPVVLVAGLSTWFVVQIMQRRTEETALAQLKSTEDGRTFNIQLANPFQPNDNPQMEMLFAGGPQWLIEWLGVDLFKTVSFFQVYAPGNSFSYGSDDEGRLVINRTYQCGIGGEGTKLLESFINLQGLSLEANPVGDEIGPVLDRLSSLETLNLSNTAITDTVMPHVGQLNHLKDLDISRTDITDEGVAYLSKLPALESLNLYLTNVSDECVDRLRLQLPTCDILTDFTTRE